jgi:dGTPase
MPQPSTLEAQVVRFADRIAYVNHDVDDAIRAGLLEPHELPNDVLAVLGTTHAERVNALVADLVESSADRPDVRLSEPVGEALTAFRQFMFDRVYLRDDAQAEQEKAVGMVRSLFSHYLDHPAEIPEEYHHAPGDLATRVADYIAGMTDRFALRTYQRLFLPEGWLL